jgi:hypothetical protein
MGTVTVGVDVGQRVDPTAIAVGEADPRTNAAGRDEVHHVIRHLERLPLGTPYPHVGERVAAVCAGIKERSGDTPRLFLDATGVGLPLVDALVAAGVEALINPVFFTHGDKRTVENGEVKLGKAWLVGRLQVLLQGDRLHLPDTAAARVLADELLNYEIKVDPDGNDKYGAFKVGTHDDLVTCLGLAVQLDHLVGRLFF